MPLVHSMPIRVFSTDETKEEKKEEKKRNLNRPYVKPDFLDDNYDHLSKDDPNIRESVDLDDEDFLPDFFSKDA